MACPQTTTILKLLAGELTGQAERDACVHIQSCPVCASACAELREGWDALDGWDVDTSEIDLTDRVLAAAEVTDRHEDVPIVWHAYWRRPLRTAASIVLAVGLGTGAGHLATSRQPAIAGEQHQQVEGMTVALEWLEGSTESATGLSSGLPILIETEGGSTP